MIHDNVMKKKKNLNKKNLSDTFHPPITHWNFYSLHFAIPDFQTSLEQQFFKTFEYEEDSEVRTFESFFFLQKDVNISSVCSYSYIAIQKKGFQEVSQFNHMLLCSLRL